MTREEVFDGVCEIVAIVAEVSLDRVTGGTRFADLKMDSMQLLEVVAMSERKFRVELPDDVLPRLTSVDAAVDAVLDIQSAHGLHEAAG